MLRSIGGKILIILAYLWLAYLAYIIIIGILCAMGFTNRIPPVCFKIIWFTGIGHRDRP